jgi:hypothetical protein
MDSEWVGKHKLFKLSGHETGFYNEGQELYLIQSLAIGYELSPSDG